MKTINQIIKEEEQAKYMLNPIPVTDFIDKYENNKEITWANGKLKTSEYINAKIFSLLDEFIKLHPNYFTNGSSTEWYVILGNNKENPINFNPFEIVKALGEQGKIVEENGISYFEYTNGIYYEFSQHNNPNHWVIIADTSIYEEFNIDICI